RCGRNCSRTGAVRTVALEKHRARAIELPAFPAGQEIFDCEPTELDMNPNLTFARAGFLRPTRFVVVYDRIPRTDGHCALCGHYRLARRRRVSDHAHYHEPARVCL